jgi:membrane dipeptidase
MANMRMKKWMNNLVPGLLFLVLIIPYCGFSQISENELSKKVDKIHKKILTIDSHTDTPLNLMDKGFDISKNNKSSADESKYDFPRMKLGGLDAAFFAVFIPQGARTVEGNFKAKAKADRLFDTIYAVLDRYPDLVGLATSPSDAYHLKRKGKQAIFIGIENGYPIGNDLSLIQAYYSKGARYITLCHTKNNDISDSSTDTTEFTGLSEFGKNVVMFMNKIGMMVDVSHISDKAFYDVLTYTKAPVIASHSCAREICNNKRNLDDRMLQALAKNDGVIQMCILSDYVRMPDPNPARDSAWSALRKKYSNYETLTEAEQQKAHKEWNEMDHRYPEKLATVQEVVDHVDHIVKVAGINHVGIGTDFDGGGGVTGCFDVSEMKNITKELVKRGYSTNEIRKIWGGNLMRVMKKVQRISRKLNPPCNC